MYPVTEAIPMPEGLTACLLPLGPAMWHEFALHLDWATPGGTIDLLLAADRITRQPDCDRATAALILAKAAAAGFHRGAVPPGFEPDAARAFTRRLCDDMVTRRFATARFGLPPAALRLVHRELGPHGPLAMPPLPFGRGAHNPPHGFDGLRLRERAEMRLAG